MNISELVKAGTRVLSDSSDSPRLDAELLLGVVLRKSRTQLITYGDEAVGREDEQLFEELLAKRLQGQPVAHITGSREFWSIPFKVSSATLVPRPETELLVEQALSHIPIDEAVRVLDLGTGSGAIIIAIATERPHAELHATDVSEAALTIARNNGSRCDTKISWHCGSWYAPFHNECFDIIVSNPPYIGTDETGVLDPELKFEPKQALYSGRDGLDDIRLIVSQAPAHLNPDGRLLLEHGYGQGEAVREIFAAHGFAEISTFCDLSGQPRVTAGRLPPARH